MYIYIYKLNFFLPSKRPPFFSTQKKVKSDSDFPFKAFGLHESDATDFFVTWMPK